ncbi:MAG: hypothetical protein HYT48_01345 [Candidatus Vogelbacteria bacterium]|nr:hypothetical protein [Candidatus Vogelbacteria bacterium]
MLDQGPTIEATVRLEPPGRDVIDGFSYSFSRILCNCLRRLLDDKKAVVEVGGGAHLTPMAGAVFEYLQEQTKFGSIQGHGGYEGSLRALLEHAEEFLALFEKKAE